MKRITIIILSASALLFSCAKQEKPQALEPNPVAEVTFIAGDVRAFVSGEWSSAVAGQVLLATDSLDIPATAICELKDAGNRVAQTKGAIKGDVAKLLETGTQVVAPKPVRPLSAKTQATINKLATKPKFDVTTPTAVAGVRGAQGRRPMPADTSKKDSSSHK